ncbi:MAG: phosphatidate cytidylyltransferase [Planctomycetota bacterium]
MKRKAVYPVFLKSDDPIEAILAQSSNTLLDAWTIGLVLAVLATLTALLAIGKYLKRQPETHVDPAIIRNFNKRVTAWLTICVILVVALWMNKVVTVILFGLVSFWALREFYTMTPTRPADHRTLFWVLFGFTPIQYVLVGMDLYDFYTIVIPVYASLFIPARIAFTGDPKRFLDRTAKITFGLFICVYSLSHAAALLNLDLATFNTASGEYERWRGAPAGLLFFFIIMVQFSDMLHFIWDRMFGKHVIASKVNATKTWEGLIGAACCTTIFAMLVQSVSAVTPFTWYGAGLMALLISVMASSGTMTMSAIKRDRGVKDYGTLVQGHAGVLDRIDSVCFAAPIFFHLTRYCLNAEERLQVIPQFDGLTQSLTGLF